MHNNEFDVIDHPLVREWWFNLFKSKPLAVDFLVKGNNKAFKGKWGNPTGFTRSFEYWNRNHSGIIIYVYSGSDSTYYQVKYRGEKERFELDDRIGKSLIDFFEKLLRDFIIKS